MGRVGVDDAPIIKSALWRSPCEDGSRESEDVRQSHDETEEHGQRRAPAVALVAPRSEEAKTHNRKSKAAPVEDEEETTGG
jgi:hypothetical protein